MIFMIKNDCYFSFFFLDIQLIYIKKKWKIINLLEERGINKSVLNYLSIKRQIFLKTKTETIKIISKLLKEDFFSKVSCIHANRYYEYKIIELFEIFRTFIFYLTFFSTTGPKRRIINAIIVAIIGNR